jgi:hypothetical protein
MKLIAIKTVRYGGQRYAPGEEFEAEGRWADLMQRAGIARLSEGDEAPRRRGRPKGSTNKPVVTHDANVITTDLVVKADDGDQDEQ